MKCKACGCWNKIEVEKILFEVDSSEPKVKIFVPMYLSLRVEVCRNCKNVVAQPKELIRILKSGIGEADV
jgi:hypothetical protein